MRLYYRQYRMNGSKESQNEKIGKKKKPENVNSLRYNNDVVNAHKRPHQSSFNIFVMLL